MATQTPKFTPFRFARQSPADQLLQSRRFLAQMRTRRTVRQFSPELVPYELIENAIATAATAPSGANQQPWTFVVVSNPALKQQIREAAEREEQESYAHRMSDEWLSVLAPLGTDWHKPHLVDAPFLIVVFLQAYGLSDDPPTHSQNKVKHYYVVESVGIAVGFLLCSLHQVGLATLTHTPSPMGFLSELLQRPPNERAVVVIPVGYPAEDAQVPVIAKKSLDNVLVRFD